MAQTVRAAPERLFPEAEAPGPPAPAAFEAELAAFDRFGKRTRIVPFPDRGTELPVYVNEFWTSKQRAAHSLHEISYRACFKPQLPRFFITRLTRPDELVHDPFMGRGTTPLEAALLGRRAVGSDLNPLSARLLEPRFDPPELVEVEGRLASFDLERSRVLPEDLLTFYHPATLRRIVNLRGELLGRRSDGRMDRVDRWIQMVATNRLTGHSPGFFSVYTLPPTRRRRSGRSAGSTSAGTRRRRSGTSGRSSSGRPARCWPVWDPATGRGSRAPAPGCSPPPPTGLRRSPAGACGSS